MRIRTRRIYGTEPEPADGLRVFVERLWPRGIKKEDAAIDVWAKEVAPSTELRKWFHLDPTRWSEFKRRYFAELDANEEAVAELVRAIGEKKATLLYGAKDEEHNGATALIEYLERNTR